MNTLRLLAATAVVMLWAAPGATATPPLPAHLDLSEIRTLPLQHDGRWPPLDTVARDTVESVTGVQHWSGHDPIVVTLAWAFSPDQWKSEPLITIPNRHLRAELKLPANRETFSFIELATHRPLIDVVRRAAAAGPDHKLDALEEKAMGIQKQLTLLNQALGGRQLLAIPDPKDPKGAWQPLIGDNVPAPVREAWTALRTSFLADDGPGFLAASRKLKAALAALPAAYYPTDRRMTLEVHFNRLAPFRRAWEIMALGALLAAMALAVRRRWFDMLTTLMLLAGFAVLSYGLWQRWQIAGRIPASNMYESLLFLGWGTGALAILSMLLTRQRLVPLTASVMGALALMLADILPLDHYIRPIAPVLMDTAWMAIHVPIIMVSYAVLALAVLIAHVQLVVLAAAPQKREAIAAVDRLHYWYVQFGALMLTAGIITGSMWASSSWGRYWGWDPKEVWSLVALLAYLAILHVRIDHEKVPGWMYAVAFLLGAGVFALVVPKLGTPTPFEMLAVSGAVVAMVVFLLARGELATVLKSVLAFWLIIMTYVGVNFVLGIGLHSYAFGKGAVVHYLYPIGGADLAFVLLCCVVYLARRPGRDKTLPVAA